ncbi:amino acid adenylation domain-containing protein [Lentzea fradiae]|uniref:Amino acid adenylation domain-containing protein n=1 Tax=Lentzea fradiae TaxID=200378 RepID=A0A1G8BDR8_9PSEU|nr:non-ribosomal peptide synthetase [Lentzea fradiae]SDH31163.1 amino acid adenylation domain-containing protein [Lentzea fradiae]
MIGDKGLSPARAELLRRWRRGRTAAVPAPTIPRRAGTGPAVLSFAQERLWVLDQFLGPGNAYNTIPLAARLTGPLDVGLLEHALRLVVARHEVLRSRFITVDGQPRQVVDPGAPVHVELVDLRGEADPEAEALRRAVAARGTPFDLSTGPLFSTRLFRVGEREHVLLHLTHHIVSDGWSDDVLIREIATAYLALSEGREPVEPPLPVQYADYAEWQRGRLTGQALRDLLDHWRTRLEGAPTALELPTDHPRPTTQRFIAATCPLTIPADVTTGLKDLARAEGATLFMTVLAAVNVLLAHYSGQRDILVGSPVAGRTVPATEDLIGCFVNTLVLRTDLGGDPTFRELLGRVRSATLGAYTHQELPFERLVEELQPVRDTSRNPLFQVMVAVQNSPPRALEFGGFRLEPIEVDNGVAKFDITIDLREYEGELTGRVQYDSDLFGQDTRDRMTRHLRTLLAGVVAGPDRRLSELPLMSAAELDQVLLGWNDTARERPERCLHRIIADRTAEHPSAVAVSAPDGQLTYGELARRAARLAGALRELGVGPDTPVGLLVDRSALLPVGVLGILQAGGGYVPLDPTYPPGRIADVVADARVPVVVTTSALTGLLGAYDGPLVLLDRPHGGRSATGADPTPDCLAYVIHTSGSTGRPKGVMITHRAAANMIISTLDDIGIGVGDAVLQFATMCFDVSVLEVFAALCSGARLVIPDRETLLDPVALTALMAREQVTTFDIPPAVLELLPPDGVPSLRVQFIGCEAFGGELATRWQRPHRRLINGYGPTEATVMMTLMELDRPYTRMPPIGRPMPNHQVYLLNRDGAPVPVGVPGELHIGGTGLARGYLGKPGMTADRFVPDPFGRDRGGRLYRTGDLARYQPDGTLEFLGRADQQVKIRGLRIEPGEIEEALKAHPDVRHAVAVVHEPAGGAKQLVAYVHTGRTTGDFAAELRSWLAGKLPAYLLPQVVVPLERFPLTPSGKVDRAALPDPASALEAVAEPAAAAGGGLERELGEQVFAEVLGVDRVSPHDSFFQLGGNSLELARLQSRIAERFDVRVPLRVLFEGPSVAQLARHLEALGVATAEAAPAGATRAPLTWQQRRLWERGAVAKPLAARIRGWLDADVVREAVDRLADRHEALRTVFDTSGPEPVQLVDPAVRPAFAVVGAAGVDEALRVVAEEVRHGFDLATGPPARVTLVRLGDFDHLLVVSLHPVLWDGASRGILARDLLVLGDIADGELPPPSLRYVDYAAWQRDWLTGEECVRSTRYWETRLAGASAPRLPGHRPGIVPGPGARHPVELPEGTDAGVAAVARRENATPHHVLLAAFVTALRELTGQDDVVAGVPLANRVVAGAGETVGHFVTTAPIRPEVPRGAGFGAVVRAVRAAIAEASEHQQAPPPAEAPAMTFDLLEAAAELPAAVGVEIEPVEVDTGHADFELTLAVERRRDGLHAQIRYATEVYPPEAVRGLAEAYVAVLVREVLAG